MIDVWSGRTPASNDYKSPGSPGVIAPVLDQLKRQGQELADKTTNLFRSAGITISNSLMTLANSLRVEGTLTTTGTANIGGQMNVTGDAVFSGNLSVPNGSISNDALNSPVAFDTQFVDFSNPNVQSGEVVVGSFTMPVPSGYTRAMVMAVADAGITAPSAGALSVRARCAAPNDVTNNSGSYSSYTATSNVSVSAHAALAREYTGLSGGSFTFSVITIGAQAWGACPGFASLNVTALFTR